MTVPINYKEDLEIDLAILEKNWSEQALLFAKWGELHAQVTSIRDRKREELDIKKAEVEKDIRSNPGKYSLDKITENAISACLKTEESIKKLSNELIDLNESVNILSVGKTSFDHRKEALKGLTQLYCADYFAKPNIPEKARDTFDRDIVTQKHKEALKEGSEKLKKRPVKRNV